MTAFTGDDPAAAARSAEAQELIDQAQSDDVLLTLLTAMDLCVLGGPRQALFDEAPARKWGTMRRGARKKVPAAIIDDLEERGLLIQQAPTVPLAAPGGGRQPDRTGYVFSPRLGLVMAARSRPTIAITCEQQNVPSRYPRFFVLGDAQDPVRAAVLEAPIAAPPGDFPHLRNLGPLGWFYRYDLVSTASAADFLARWALLQSRRHPDSPRLVTQLRHDEGKLLTVQTLTVRSHDGRTAQIPGAGTSGREYDQAALAGVMARLLSPQQ